MTDDNIPPLIPSAEERAKARSVYVPGINSAVVPLVVATEIADKSYRDGVLAGHKAEASERQSSLTVAFDKGMEAQRTRLLAALRKPSDEVIEACARAMVAQWGGDPDTGHTISSATPRLKLWQLYVEQARTCLIARADWLEKHDG